MEFIEKSRVFIHEAWVETTKKTTWPSRADLRESTIVVIVSVFILSTLLGVLDLLLSRILGLILKILT